MVFAAASLADVLTEVAEVVEADHPGVDVRLSFAGSSSLRTQILEGAPADVFVSADEANMAVVAAAGELAEAPVVVAANRLAIVVPAGNPGGVTGLADLGRDDLLVGVCAAGVPCGDLARAVLDEAGVVASIDTDEPDVGSLLTKVVADELDAGLVYETDVRRAGADVEGIAVASDLTNEYPIAVLAEAPNPTTARVFVDFVRSSEGRRILADQGFLLP